MKLLVTGASGFLGDAVVRAAIAAGHQVKALVRPIADVSALEWPAEVEILRGDLRQRGDWCAELGDVEAVVHLAAALTGDLSAQFAGTVVATENLLEHLDLASLRRFVHVSSFSVYDFADVRTGKAITELSPIEAQPKDRDAYTITKMFQERMVREACEGSNVSHVVLRPGAIYGPGKTWDFGRALKVGPFDLIFAPRGVFRLTFVDNCAEAIVRAVDAPVASGSTFNIVDDAPPTHGQYHKLCRKAGAATGKPLHVPWFLVSGIGRAVGLLNRFAFKGRAKLPEILSHRRQQARWKPFAYPNATAKAALGWVPRQTLREAIEMTVPEQRHDLQAK